MNIYYLLNYVPVSAQNYGYNPTEEDWMDRHEVWHFKDGNCSPRILRGLSEGVRQLSSKDCVVCFVPASTKVKTETRYANVASRIQSMTGIPCSYTAISKETDGASGYISGKQADPASDFCFNVSFFQGKKVILIDDVVTRGNTLKGTASRLLEKGAREVVALTVARTFNPLFQNATAAHQIQCANSDRKC